MNETRHVSVMPDEVLHWIDAEKGGIFLDGTFGGGGHTRRILSVSSDTRVVACDRDGGAVQRGDAVVKLFPGRLEIHHCSFAKILEEPDIFGKQSATMKFDGMLLDLGMSTDQLHEQRGFSFRDEAALDMRMNDADPVTAGLLVNESSRSELQRILRSGGVGKELSRVVAAIERHRPFATARELGEAMYHAIPPHERGDSHPATVVFQALRIAVNREFEELHAFLDRAPYFAKDNARLVIISFHSLEDEVVTKAFRQWERGGDTAPAWYPGSKPSHSKGKLLTKKAITPSPIEIKDNPASRSARLRVFEFHGHTH